MSDATAQGYIDCPDKVAIKIIIDTLQKPNPLNPGPLHRKNLWMYATNMWSPGLYGDQFEPESLESSDDSSGTKAMPEPPLVQGIRAFKRGGGRSIEPPKTLGGGLGKGSFDRQH